jgi:hypothetical protein
MGINLNRQASAVGLVVAFVAIFSAHTQVSARYYQPSPNNVATQGPNASYEGPYSNFMIKSDNNNANLRITIEGACLVKTAGSAGLSATYRGVTKSSNGDCNGSDLVFSGVQGNAKLVVHKINGQGNQPFNVNVTGDASAYVTQIDNPDRTNPNPTQNELDNRAIGVWMGGGANFKFNVPCDYNGAQKAYYKFKDADVGLSNQPNKPQLRLWAWNEKGVDLGYIPINVTSGNNSWQTAEPDVLVPGWSYEYRWSNTGGLNAILHVLPWGEYRGLGKQDCGGGSNTGGDPSTVSDQLDYKCENNKPFVKPKSLQDPATRWFMGTADGGGGNSGGSASGSADLMKTRNQWWELPPGVASLFDGAHTITFYFDGYSIVPDTNKKDAKFEYNGKDSSGNTAFRIVNQYCNNVDYPPSMNSSMTCSTIVLSNLYDANNRSGQQYKYYGVVYNRNADGERGSIIKDFTGFADGAGGVLYLDKMVPNPADNNHGLIVDVGLHNFDVNGNRIDTPDGYVTLINNSVGSCYVGECSVSITGGIVPGSEAIEGDQVIRNSKLTVSLTINNTGDDTRLPLYDDVAGSQLSFIKSGGDVDFQPVDFIWGANTSGVTSIVPGESLTGTFTIDAPNDFGNYTLSGYVGYKDRFGVYKSVGDEVNIGACSTIFTTYQPYEVKTTANITGTVPDVENPDSIEYKISDSRTAGQYSDVVGSSYYTGDIKLNALAKLYYIPKSTGVESAPSFHEIDYTTRTYNATGLSPLASTWNDNPIYINKPEFRRQPAVDATWVRGDRYCASYNIADGFGWIGPGGVKILTAPRNAGGCEGIVDRPFVRVYGNDIWAGATFAGGTPSAGGAYGYSRYSDATHTSAGSGTEFGILATNSISGLSSVFLRKEASGMPYQSSGLTFSNSDINNLGNAFIAGDAVTIPDWYSDTRKAGVISTATGNIASLTDGKQYQASGPLTINGVTGYTGQRTIYVDGDVIIASNNTYNNVRTTDLDTIPSLVIIAKGNIRINPGVTQFDAILVAQPTSATTGGLIYTCNVSAGLENSDLFRDTCKNKLRVNGALIAKQVRFLRTGGTLRDVPVESPGASPTKYKLETYYDDHAAESIRMTPDTFLSKHILEPVGGPNIGKYDYIEASAPVL